MTAYVDVHHGKPIFKHLFLSLFRSVPNKRICFFISVRNIDQTDHSARALKGTQLQQLSCWNRGFEFRCGHACMSAVFVVCCVADHSFRGVLPGVYVCV